ncbi:hypothetical protein NCAS_0G00390 [Naumovozyma castellii]|uniref:Tr-type G domain-containing protein n=1 Tax=Naumovozyma castellii TaxID=27288 RepID=G0VHP2_NAUCA|nr:hypothetical protein NCAS_0G00390 [Naumovozyma castellii CBS 4309]CCC70926.1 hypothetical protein NCAS_0G00390 [Naumovozyma castellii CBS 4309]
MSRLEQLARERALKNKNLGTSSTSSEDKPKSRLFLLRSDKSLPSSSDSDPATNTSASSLLESLKSKRNNKSLSAILQEKRGQSKNHNDDSESKSPLGSLSSKLLSLKRKPEEKTTDRDQRPSKTQEEDSKPLDAPNTWDLINRLQLQLHDSENHKSFNDYTEYQIMKLLSNGSLSRPRASQILKRNYDDLFTVYYPSNKKTKIRENFGEPSPDDIILNAQLLAFNDVHEKVSKLALEADKKTKEPIKLTKPTPPKNPIEVRKYVDELKPYLNFVMLGNESAGKSTIIGRLLEDSGLVRIDEIRSVKKELEKSKLNAEMLYLSKLMEKKMSSTFSLDKNVSEFSAFDIPGDLKHLSSSIKAIRQCTTAILTIDCNTDAFESAFNMGSATIQHIYLCKQANIDNIIIMMNKMDTIDWDQGRYFQIKNELQSFLSRLGFKKEQFTWIPSSGLYGQGIVHSSYPKPQNWESCPTLSEKLISLTRSHSDDNIADSPFFFSLTKKPRPAKLDVEDKRGDVYTLMGEVLSGSIQIGESMTIYPSKQSVTVEKISKVNTEGNTKRILQKSIAIEMDQVILTVSNLYNDKDIRISDVAASIGHELLSSTSFQTDMFIFETNKKPSIGIGSRGSLYRDGAVIPVKIKNLTSTQESAETSDQSQSKMPSNCNVNIECETERPVVLLDHKNGKKCGNLVLYHEETIVATGTFI